jgi:hypothetical protein
MKQLEAPELRIPRTILEFPDFRRIISAVFEQKVAVIQARPPMSNIY